MPTDEPPTLYEHTRRVGAEGALAWAGETLGGGAVVFAATPTAYHLGQLNGDGDTADRRGQPLALAGVFDLRVFAAAGELRWHRQPQGRSTAVLLADTPLTNDHVAHGYATRVEQQYLLWGRVQHADGGWAQLAEFRVPPLEVPVIGAAAGNRVILTACEYLTADAAVDGNTTVLAERLLGLATAKEPT